MLTSNARSVRLYPHIRDIRSTISRNAFTQLNFSKLVLAVTLLGMCFLFIAPILVPLLGNKTARFLSFLAWSILFLIYIAFVRFYSRPFIWAITIPLAAVFYMGSTIDSARLYWQGKGGLWKGRSQA